jgi:hypothetical protein
MPSWIPGDDYLTNFHKGDPYISRSKKATHVCQAPAMQPCTRNWKELIRKTTQTSRSYASSAMLHPTVGSIRSCMALWQAPQGRSGTACGVREDLGAGKADERVAPLVTYMSRARTRRPPDPQCTPEFLRGISPLRRPGNTSFPDFDKHLWNTSAPWLLPPAKLLPWSPSRCR